MRNDKYWKYGCFAIAVVMLLVCVHIARLDVLLRKYCKDVEIESFFAQKGLCFLMLLATAYTGFVLWQWIAERPVRRKALTITLTAVCLYAALTGGYLRYHHTVFQQSSRQEKYEKAYDKGLVYDLKSLFK